MKELILKLSIKAPYSFPWEKAFKNKNIDISKEEVLAHLRDLGINTFDSRKEFSWNVELAIYESAVKYNTLEDIVENTKAKLKRFTLIYPYISNEVINYELVHKGINTEKKLEIFKRTLENTLTDKEKGEYKEVVTSWLIEMLAWNIIMRGFETVNEINEEIFKIIEDKYSYLNVDRESIKTNLIKLGIGLGKNIELFKSAMKIDKERYEALFMKENIYEELVLPKVIKEEMVEKEKEDDLTESILGLFENMEEKKEIKVKVKKFEKKPIKENKEDKCESKVDKNALVNEIILANENKEIAGSEKEGNKLCKEVGNEEEVYKKLAALAEILGYELVDHSKVQVLREYYEKLNSSKSEEERVIKQLVSLEKGAVLSQLYNTYKNLNSTSLDNIEAVMSNFFATLATMGFEVNEEEVCIGEKITVNTKDLFKEFIFSRPVNKDGEIIGQVQYLSWNYKDKIIMPKIIKPIE